MTYWYGLVLNAVLKDGVWKATKYVSPTLVIKATRRRYQGKLSRCCDGTETVLVTVGKPNYLEREFIKVYRKAGEPFPVKRIQLKRVG